MKGTVEKNKSSCKRLQNNHHFFFQLDAESIANRGLSQIAKRKKVMRGRIARIHEKIGVFGGNLGAVDLMTLESALIDEPSGGFVG